MFLTDKKADVDAVLSDLHYQLLLCAADRQEVVLSDFLSWLLFCTPDRQKAVVEPAFGEFQQHIKVGCNQSITVYNQHDLVLSVTHICLSLSLLPLCLLRHISLLVFLVRISAFLVHTFSILLDSPLVPNSNSVRIQMEVQSLLFVGTFQ